ncbi:non-homologous end-joining DNA ligase [Fictibacillus nanhaiensis]|uniref:non-homologous end-joining DNA ligase n=1 Tax=Fictibacillus nanhaiensis TaxID=742169 RepID=UPI002E200833|nr:non-homologous end-joining DNA ligase [Fictibacillus nanhaiensis]MED1862875.1 non-homologous end-joining DNA ligase [Fictibacillus nanhaiensis]
MIQHFLKPMLPSLANELPEEDHWVYEVKYDGFRCLLFWDHGNVILTSRNGHPLHTIFPEIVAHLKTIENKVKDLFPILLDGELCILENENKANFELIQKRGRLKQPDKIEKASEQYPSSYCAFDLLAIKDEYIYRQSFLDRKEKLRNLIQISGVQNNKILTESRLNFINFTSKKPDLMEDVEKSNSEGIVAKKLYSKWAPGIRTKEWIKVKNLKFHPFILLGYDTDNGFFHVGVKKDRSVQFVGLFSHGISPEEKEALIQIVKNNIASRNGSLLLIEPSICVELSYLELYKDQLRQPRFVTFRFDTNWEDCTWESLQKNK